MNKDLYKDSYQTSSFYTAVFCYVKGLQLIDIDRSDPKRAQFVFADTPNREHLLKRFNFAKRNSPEVMVDAREFVTAIKELKDKLYQKGGIAR